MKAVTLNQDSYGKILSVAERILKLGEIVIAPTDTVYGILGDATKAGAIKKIFTMKGRPAEKALPIFVKDIATARKYAYISDEKTKFLERVWPGSITAIFSHKEKLPKILTGGLDTIGIRIPNHQFLLELLSRLDFPLAQTSANICGHRPGQTADEIKQIFTQAPVKPDLVVDGGELRQKPSAVIDFVKKEPIVLRSGLLSKSQLDQLLGSL